MTQIELNEFYDEYMYLSIFLRTKKIYELTNNLDLFLLKALKIDFNKHYLQKALQLAKELDGHVPSQNTEYDEIAFRARDFLASSIREMDKNELKIVNQSIDGILSTENYELVEMIFEGMADFLYDIDELIRYKENINKTIDVAQGENENEAQDELIDYSESNNVSKIIFLQKLGLIEYMRSLSPFNTTINSLANALSGVTGIKPSTIQPMLNAMLSKGTSEKNNPLKSIKTVNVVINKLANIGFKAE
ncbi:hypothetical protein [Flavobacterium aquicola]|uniref:Uncharacterized protein n=1 Tax=Flavobacterium aquicola TaxID=1682742 RepID=A0A3E0E930_9FLAO|nr:hypothetical protein [Flavobacterium aquicola]REG94160.1 hypothetical protein C8P67_113136 [Flavobacterium aquicola]